MRFGRKRALSTSAGDALRLGNGTRQRIRQGHARIIGRTLSRPGRPGKNGYVEVDKRPGSRRDGPEVSTTKTYDDELSGPFEGDGQKSRLVNVSTVQGQFIGNSAALNPVSSIASRRARSYAFATHSSTRVLRLGDSSNRSSMASLDRLAVSFQPLVWCP